MRTITIIAAAALAALTAVPALSQSPESRRDDIVLADVYRVFENDIWYTMFDIVDVTVDQGVVKLSGFVTDPFKKKHFAERIAKEIEGVRDVENKLTVLPASYYDEQIRRVLAYSIYNDGRLLRYANMRWPWPIHIIVSGGRVTLEGVVYNRMDERLLESKARNVFGVTHVVSNLSIE